MKKMYTYNKFIVESVRDKMTPKSKNDIEHLLLKLPYSSMVSKIKELGDRFTEDEIQKIFYKLDPEKRLKLGVDIHLPKLVKSSLEDGVALIFISSALVDATINGDIQIVKILLNGGANIWFNNGEPLRKAREYHHRDLIHLYRKLMYESNESVRDKMSPKSTDDIKIILDKLEPKIRIKKIISMHILDCYTKEEIKDMLDNLDILDKTEVILKNELWDYYNRDELRDILDRIGDDFKIILQSDKFINLLSIERFNELKKYLIDVLVKYLYYNKNASFYKDRTTGRYDFDIDTKEGFIMINKLQKYNNGIYVVLDKYDFGELKLFITKKNISFSEISSTEYKIWSHDKIKIVLDKLVDDILNGKREKFSILKIDYLMR